MSKKNDSCGKCNKVVKESTAAIQCDICDTWWHAACVGMESELCESAGKNSQLHWYCIKCNPGSGKMVIEMKKLQDKLETVEECMRRMDEKMEKIRVESGTQMDKALKELNKNVTEKMKANDVKQLIADELKKFEEKGTKNEPKWSEIVSKEVGNRFAEITGDIDVVQKTVSETKEKIMDNDDKLKRRNNIIMYKVEESKLDTVAEKNYEDMDFCGQMMEKVLKVGYEKGDIVKVVRLGKIEEKKMRPLLIEFCNAHVKNVVMENVSKLGSAKGDFEGITISHDMTVKEREQCRELVEEAKKKQIDETGNFVYRVRGLPGQMKIVKFQKAR
jgi:putative lipoic acid-binding regulatory protein